MSAVWVIAALGQSPGVLTELVWALCREGHDVLGVEVWTTTHGVSRFAADLDERATWLQLAAVVHPRRFPLPPPPDALRAHPPPAADELDAALRRRDTFAIRILTASDGTPLDDIRTSADADALQEALYDRIELLTEALPATVQLVGSMAGGRKTLSAALHAAFTMHANLQARLLHVLVHPELEAPLARLRDFRFPGDGSQERWIASHPGATMPPQDDLVCLTDIPFAASAAWRYHFDAPERPTWSSLRQLRRDVRGLHGQLTWHGVEERWEFSALNAQDTPLCEPLGLSLWEGLALAGVVASRGGEHADALDALDGIPAAVELMGSPPGDDADAVERRIANFRQAVHKLRRRTEPWRGLGLSDLCYRKDKRGIVAPILVIWSTP